MRQNVDAGQFAPTKHISAATLSLVAGTSVVFWWAVIAVASMALR